jgi:AraC-like DNA-binding protein
MLPSTPMTWLPQPLSWGCSLTACGGGFGGHIHDHEEICLVANDGSLMRHAGVERLCAAGTVYLFRQGEVHGYRNGPQQQPHLWLVHYRRDPDLDAACPRLADPDPLRRIWRLSPAQLAAWQAVFQRLMAESMYPGRVGHAAAMSSWLRLLLVQAARWDAAQPEAVGLADDPALARLWEIINEHVEAPEADFGAALARRVPNYDSLRHRFKRIYGRAPRDLLGHLRIERAKHLLLETDQPVAWLATRLGYARASEFTRAFVRGTGQTPSAFRIAPAARSEPA